MNTALNPEALQRLATDPEYSVYVNASAGSGKTKVLIDRILRLLLSGSKIENILCVVFTNAAAVEILERLQEKLVYWATCDEYILLHELLTLIGNSTDLHKFVAIARSLHMQFINAQNEVKIQTLHSFCMRIMSNIANNDVYRGNVGIMSSTDKITLLKRAIDLVFADAKHDHRSCEVLNVLASIFEYSTLLKKVEDVFSNKIQLLKHIETIQYGLDTHVDIQKRIYGVLGITELQSLTKDELIIREIKKWPMQLIINTVSKILNIEGGIAREIYSWWCIDINQRCRQFNSYAAIFLTKDGKKRVRLINSKTVKVMPDVIAVLNEHQNQVFKLVTDLNAMEIARNSCAFTQFIREVFLRSEQLKAEVGFIDYDDILTNTLYHMSPAHSGWWRWYLDCKIEHILIDEAQDLSMLQWQIINSLSEEFFAGEGAQKSNRTIFIVGDHKQAIFGFQGAEPQIFRDMCQYYRSKAQHAQKLWREVNFNISFRSSAEVLRFVDTVFSTPKYFISLGLNSACQHIPWRKVSGAVYVYPLVACHISSNNLSSTHWAITRSNNEAQVSSKTLASHIAQGINSIWQRHAGNKSIMVLFRKRGKLYDLVIEECKNLGIPVTANRNIRLVDTVVVQDLMAAARFIVSPYDDFNLAMLLRSTLIGVSEQDLFDICKYNECSREDNGKCGFLWSNIVNCSTIERYSVIYNKLQQMILYARDGSIYKFFIALLYSKIGMLGSISKSWLNLVDAADNSVFYKYIHLYGSSIYVVIEAFLEVVSNFEEMLPGGFDSFISWFLQANDEFISVEDDGADSVKITTVHAAKGLQAKIVVLADASDTENIPYRDILYDNAIWILNYGVQQPCCQLNLLKEKHAAYYVAENMRLLYVALTRAEDELHIYGRCDARSNSAVSGSWYEILAKNAERIHGASLYDCVLT